MIDEKRIANVLFTVMNLFYYMMRASGMGRLRPDEQPTEMRLMNYDLALNVE